MQLQVSLLSFILYVFISFKSDFLNATSEPAQISSQNDSSEFVLKHLQSVRYPLLIDLSVGQVQAVNKFLSPRPFTLCTKSYIQPGNEQMPKAQSLLSVCTALHIPVAFQLPGICGREPSLYLPFKFLLVLPVCSLPQSALQPLGGQHCSYPKQPWKWVFPCSQIKSDPSISKIRFFFQPSPSQWDSLAMMGGGKKATDSCCLLRFSSFP